MISSHACSSVCVQRYHLHGQGGLIREIKSLNCQRQGCLKRERKYLCLHSQRKGLVIPFQVPPSPGKPVSNIHELFRRRITATVGQEYASQPEPAHSTNISFSRQLSAFYRFSRPHTVIGTVIGIVSVSLLPVETITDISLKYLVGLLKALVPAILMNIYVVGVNQVFDVEIDKVNKPDLPLASGEFSVEFGTAVVTALSILSFAMGLIFQSPPLLGALVVSFLLGSAYSIDLPFLRWKRHALLAATCILTVRALVVQLAFFIHMQKYVLGRPIAFTRSLMFATAFMCFFSAVIALFKDIPDVEGDKHFGIQSFSVQLGKEKVFWLCINLLLSAYGSAVLIGATSTFPFSQLVSVLGHCSLAFILWLRARSTDLTDKASVTSCYMFIWKLFYLEYLLIPFIR